MLRGWRLGLMLVLATCGGRDRDDGSDGDADADGEADGDADTDADADGDGDIPIPDPGTTPVDWENWFDNVDPGCTPETATVVGEVDASPGYLGGDLCAETGDGFYVFRTAAPLGELTVNLFGTVATIEYVHVHEGDGLVFGPEVTPVESTATSGVWDLVSGSIYVVEIHSAAGGLF